MNRKLFKCVVALLIVMQCVATPISYAVGDELPADQPLFYTVAGETAPVYNAIVAANTDEGDFQYGYYFNYVVGYGRPKVGETEYTSTNGSNRFEYEGTADTVGGFNNSDKVSDDQTTWGIIDLPSDEDLGRVPDMEFDGWYIYGSDETDSNNWITWSRIDGKRSSTEFEKDIKLLDEVTSETTHGYDLSVYQVDADTVVTRLKVNDKTAYELLSKAKYSGMFVGIATTYYANRAFPIVGGWVESSNATATDAALKIAGSTEELTMYAYDSQTNSNMTSTVDKLTKISFGEAKCEETTTEDIDEETGEKIKIKEYSYYLRVGTGVEALSLDLAAFEPFLKFQAEHSDAENNGTNTYLEYPAITMDNTLTDAAAAAGSPVQITINGKNFYSIAGMKLVYEAQNDGRYSNSEGWESENSATAPAHSTWSLTGIKLDKSTPDDPYNEIVVTITPPNGKLTDRIRYTFYVQRMASPSWALEPGNTPAGMVARDPIGSWGYDKNKPETEQTAETNKAEWLEYFIENRTVRRDGYTIKGNTVDGYNNSNGGILYDGVFGRGAWDDAAYETDTETDEIYSNDNPNPEYDLDVNPEAIVAYQNYSFSDPGITIITSVGGTISSDNTDGDSIGTLQRRIKLEAPAGNYSLFEALAGEALDSANAASYVRTVYYMNGTLSENDAWETITLSEPSVNLESLEILPGVYEIEYRYIDPYSSPEKEEDYLYFERPLVVLAIPGDVDMDGATTVADAYALDYLWSNDVFTDQNLAASSRLRIFALRVCNIAETASEQVNAADIAAIEAGWRPWMVTSRTIGSTSTTRSVCDYIYPPLADPDDRYERKAASGTESKPLLGIKYLGKQAELAAGTSTDTADVTPRLAESTAVTNGDVFWVEVTVGEGAANYTAIESFTFSLIYDGRFVRPATMTDMENFAEFDTTDTTFKTYYEDKDNADWAVVMNKYNLRDGTGTVWDTGTDSASYIVTAASKPDSVHSTHFSRATTGIEAELYTKDEHYNNVGELTFSIQLNGDATPATLANGGTILRVPFYMHTYPEDYTQVDAWSMNLVSMDLGMQEFVIVDRAGTATTRAVSYAPSVDVSAYSTQDSIYGEETENLRGEISLTAESVECNVPMTEDSTESAVLTNQNANEPEEIGENAKYGTYFTHHDGSFYSKKLTGELPPGMRFDSGSGYITGTPTKAGVYSFKIDRYNYQIIVEKAPLRIYTVGATGYYGENDYTDAGYAAILDGVEEKGNAFYKPDSTHAYELTYRYYTEDLIVGTSRLDDKGTTDTADDVIYVFDGGASATEKDERNDGSMANLPLLIGERSDGAVKFNHPTVKSGRLANSNVGDYKISINVTYEDALNFGENSLLANYYFVAVNNPDDEDAEMESAAITVIPRPIIIDTLNYDTEGTQDERLLAQHQIHDTDSPQFGTVSATLSDNLDHFETSAAKESTLRPSLDGDRYLYSHETIVGSFPLATHGFVAGDTLEISYYVIFERNEKDKKEAIAPQKYFIIEEGQTETRNLEISEIQLVGSSEDINNYTIMNVGAKLADKVADGGLVSSVVVESISMLSWKDLDLNLVYGDRPELSGNVEAQLRYSGEGEQPGTVSYSGPQAFADNWMYLSVVTEDRMGWEKGQIAAGNAVYFYDDTVEGRTDMAFYTKGEGVVFAQLDETTQIESTLANDEPWYIRLAYAREVNGELVIYKTDYSPEPLTVAKRTLVLNVTTKDRYYGESNTIDYTFLVSDENDKNAGLASWDASKLAGQIPSSGVNKGVGTSDQLRMVLGYDSVAAWDADGDDTANPDDDGQSPRFFAVNTGNIVPNSASMTYEVFKNYPAVTERTDVSMTPYYVGIHEASHRNYDFVYSWPGSTTRSAEYGYAGFTVHQRPIVINSLPSGSLATVYSDMTETDYISNEPRLIVTDLSITTANSGLTFVLPEKRTGSATTFYVPGNDNAVVEQYTITGEAIVEGDTLSLLYDIELLKDNVEWTNLNDGYFNMLDGSGKVLGERTVNTVLQDLTLSYDGTDNRSRNYKIVYDSASDAEYTIPKSAVAYDRTLSASGNEFIYTPADEVDVLSDPYYYSGIATVKTRPVTGVTLTNPPSKTAYTYGELFYPTGLVVTLTMETTYGTLAEIGHTSSNNELIIDDAEDNKLRFTYSERLFSIYGLDIALKKEGGSEIDIEYEDLLVPATHDGGYIVVSGRRIPTHTEVLSYSGEDYMNEPYKITVAKKVLTVSVVDQYRYYGENNYSTRYAKYGDAVYEYTFSIGDLIDRDKAAITDSNFYDSVNSLGYGYISALASADNQNSALYNLDNSFIPPTISTEATAGSDINTTTGYTITISGGSMSNYEFNYVGGALRVYPRPIKVTGYYAAYSESINSDESSADRSIFGIYTASDVNVYTRTLPYIDTSYRADKNTVFGAQAGVDGELQPGITYTTNALLSDAIDGWQWFEVKSAAPIDTNSTAAATEYRAAYLNDAGYRSIPAYAKFYLSAAGIIGNDNPSFTTRISFAGANMNVNPTFADATVTGIAHSGERYYFDGATTGEDLPATIDIRLIGSIDIFALPTRSLDSYAYGDTLDLNGLSVRITYALGTGESEAKVRVVRYIDDFSMYGLYVNYYNSDSIPASSDDYAGVVTNYRPASSGDHLTIAPVHDDSSLANKPTTWEYGEFEHHGKRLIISASAEGTDYFVRPRIIRMATDIADPNASAQVIGVAPREIDYVLTAEDKDYDGTTHAVGSIEFTNIYTGDLVYAATGAVYEGNRSWTWVNGGALKSDLQTAISAGGYVFASGSVVDDGLNDRLTYTDGSWNNGTLTFEFVSPNVRFVDTSYPANTDANLTSTYWADDPNPKTPSDADWDEYESVGAMPVNVTNIILAGPDALNYTLRATDTDGKPSTPENVLEIDMTRADVPSDTTGQDYAPYATIRRAERNAFDTAALGIPVLEIDDKTGVVRVLYNTATEGEVVESVKAASASDRQTRTGVTSSDDYESELHIEYAIEYFLPGDDDSVDLADRVDYIPVAANGDHWIDTYYFGGEAVRDLYGDGTFHASSYGFVSEEEEAEELSYDTELIGQLYKWTAYDSRLDPSLTVSYRFEGVDSDVKIIQYLEVDEDDSLVPRETEWHFDGGFTFHVADTNASARVVEIGGESYYYFYGYYTTDRDPIPRSAYILGKVRIAETHNYEVSAPLYSAEGYDGTDETALDELVADADASTAERNRYIAEVAAGDREDITAPTPRTDVLKMYGYRLDIRYAEDMDSADELDETTYDVRLLRQVQFTDYLTYIEQEEMDAVLYNDITGFYSGYFWDDRYQNSLEFDEDVPIILGSPLQLEVDRDLPDGSSVTGIETFNVGSTIPIYVETGEYRLLMERWIDIVLETLEFYHDDEPFDLSTLEVVFYPPRHERLELKWTSSDESVVRITEDGKLEIVGPGTAVLTATSLFGRTDTITVVVAQRPEPPVEPPKQTGIFNHELLAEFLGLDADYFFYPEREMTRGELVMLASLFFVANDSWEKHEVIDFIDIVGSEPYAEAVALMSEWGVIVGVGGDMFAGERVATRAEAAAILGRMLGVEPANYVGKPTFIDSTINDTWASGYIAALRALGATNGIGNNLFAPNRNITRAEAVAMFTRLLNHQTPTPQVIIPADVSESHWAFGHILRAVNNVILPAKLEDAESETEE